MCTGDIKSQNIFMMAAGEAKIGWNVKGLTALHCLAVVAERGLHQSLRFVAGDFGSCLAEVRTWGHKLETQYHQV